VKPSGPRIPWYKREIPPEQLLANVPVMVGAMGLDAAGFAVRAYLHPHSHDWTLAASGLFMAILWATAVPIKLRQQIRKRSQRKPPV
jgi:hypothetical protein